MSTFQSPSTLHPSPRQATTAYGSLRDVPGDVDVLIAGTSCVDFSNMNTQRKELGADKGELRQTEPTSCQ